jgi:hypothetical protein
LLSDTALPGFSIQTCAIRSARFDLKGSKAANVSLTGMAEADRYAIAIDGSGFSSLAEEKEPLINAAFGPRISADQRNNVSANQRFILLVKVAQAKLHHYPADL